MNAFSLDLLVRSTLVMLACAAAWGLCRRCSAAVRHGVLLSGLLSLLLLPLLLLGLPEWRLPVLPSTPLTALRRPTSEAPAVRAEPTPAPPAGAAPLKVRSEAAPSESPAPPPLAPPPTSPDALAWAAFWIYLTGCAGGLSHLVVQLIRLRRFAGTCAPAGDPALLSELARAAGAMGVRRPVALRLGAETPMTWGWRHPVVALPSGSPGWPAARLRAALLHELSHVRRGDWVWGLVARVVCALYWFHPLAWWLSARLSAEGEAACDDRVLAAGMPAPAYAQSLLEVVQAMRHPKQPLLPSVGMARTHRLEARLRAILDGDRRRGAVSPGVLAVVAVVSAAVLLPSAGLRLERRASAEEIPPQMKPARREKVPAAVLPSAADEDPVEENDPAQGERLFRAHGCSGCHSPSSSVRAPELHGLYGRMVSVRSPKRGVPLEQIPAASVRADERYLRDSILVPAKQIAAGYRPIMPSFKNRLSEEEVAKLVSYLRTLGPGRGAERKLTAALAPEVQVRTHPTPEVRVQPHPVPEVERQEAAEREREERIAELEQRIGPLQEGRIRAEVVELLELQLRQLEEQLSRERAMGLKEPHAGVRTEELRRLIRRRLEAEKKRREIQEKQMRAGELQLRAQLESLRAMTEAMRKRSEAENAALRERARQLERELRERQRAPREEDLRREIDRGRNEALRAALEALRRERAVLESRIRELEKQLQERP